MVFANVNVSVFNTVFWGQEPKFNQPYLIQTSRVCTVYEELLKFYFMYEYISMNLLSYVSYIEMLRVFIEIF